MTYKIADQKHPFMGLDNKICKNPVYWCRLHQVWLSDEDVKKKQCKCKLTFDMVSTYCCGNLEKGLCRMKKHNENHILVSSPEVTELLKGFVENTINSFPNVNVPNLADYSTRFEDIK